MSGNDYGGNYGPDDQNGNGVDDTLESGHRDSDGDGIWDEYDQDRNGDGIDDVFQTDLDGNGLVDIYEDLDDDGDGISNPYDEHPGVQDPAPVVAFHHQIPAGPEGPGSYDPNWVGDYPDDDTPTDPDPDPNPGGNPGGSVPDMSVDELCELARDLSGVYQPDIAPDRLIYRFIVAAYHDFLIRAEWPFLRVEATRTLPANTDFIALPAHRLRQVAVVVNGHMRLLPVMTPRDERLLAGTGSGSAGGPVGYRVDQAQGRLRIFPAPVAPVTVHLIYDQIPTLPAEAEAVVSALPAKYQEALAYKAAARLVAREGEDQARQGWLEGEYENYINQCVGEFWAPVNDDTVSFNSDALQTVRDPRGGFSGGTEFFSNATLWEY